MTTRPAVRFLAVAVAACMVATFALPAMALAEIPVPSPLGESETNPNAPPNEWRQLWGNTLAPHFTLDTPAGAQGFLYTLDRTPLTVMDTTTVGLYNLTPVVSGTQYGHTLDLAGTYMYPPVGGWPPMLPGMTNPLEGVWWWHFVYYGHASGATDFSRQVNVPFGVDVTPPTAVENVRVSPDPSVPPATSIVGGGTRATVWWDGKDYDALSGTAYYNVYVDGELKFSGLTDTEGGAGVAQPPLWYVPTWTSPYFLTIEDLTPGTHTFEVTAVDRATNEGAKSAAASFFSDPDAPVVTMTSPAANIINPIQTLSAYASDAGGITEVAWYLDGVLLKRMTSAPYSYVADLSGFALGTHTLRVVAKDMFGRVAMVTRTVSLVRPPALSSVTAGPSPFYPIRRDGYRDYWTATFSLSQAANVSLKIYDSAGNLTKTISATRSAGRSSLRWDGRNASGRKAVGRYTAVLVASNANGSTKSGTLVTYIRSYQIIRLSRNRVRVIPR